VATDGHEFAKEAAMPAAPRMLIAGVLTAVFAVLTTAPASARTPRVSAADGLVARVALGAAPRGVTDGDPRDEEAWHLSGDAPMGVWSAWSRTTGGDVTVAVADTGADLTHPDLAPNLWTNPGEVPGNGVDDDHDGTVDDVHGVDLVGHDGDPSDDNGHGTHVAGIIGARGDNGIGASGVAWRVRLMVVKVLDSNADGNTSTVADGVRWAVAHGARIVNLSLAGAGRSADLENALVTAQNAGVLVVVAAGNDHHDLGLLPSYPASYPEPNVLGVAATRPDSLLSILSSFGSGVDLSAPGETIFSTARGGGYEYRTGTSMASPMVAGTAALLLAQRPDLDAGGVVAALTGAARHNALPVGAGALDAGAALGGPLPSSAPAAAPGPDPAATAAAAKAKKAKAKKARAKAAKAKAAKARAAKAKAAKARAAKARRARAAKARKARLARRARAARTRRAAANAR
jgi:subtilisin family serine protease